MPAVGSHDPRTQVETNTSQEIETAAAAGGRRRQIDVTYY
jgi:hypothetical protein